MSRTSDFFGTGGSHEQRMQAVEQQVSQFIAGEVGKIVYFPTWYTPPQMLYIKENGAVLSKTTYAALWNTFAESSITVEAYDQIVADSPIGACSRYADVDADNFRIPTDGTGGFIRSMGANGEMPLGTEDGGFDFQIENITGGVNSVDFLFSATAYDEGALQTERSENTVGVYYDSARDAIADSTWGTGASFDASRVAKTGDETSPQGTYAQPYLYTGITASNLPEPTSTDLAQIQTNTDAIAEINNQTKPICDCWLISRNNPFISDAAIEVLGFRINVGGFSINGSGRLIVPKSGHYRVRYSQLTQTEVSSSAYIYTASVNGVLPANAFHAYTGAVSTNGGGLTDLIAEEIVYLNTGDALNPYVWTVTGTVANWSGSGHTSYIVEWLSD